MKTQRARSAPNPFICDQCPQSFNRNIDLELHKRIHLAPECFTCSSCDQNFSCKTTLERHLLFKDCGKKLGFQAEGAERYGSPAASSDVATYAASLASAETSDSIVGQNATVGLAPEPIKPVDLMVNWPLSSILAHCDPFAGNDCNAPAPPPDEGYSSGNFSGYLFDFLGDDHSRDLLEGEIPGEYVKGNNFVDLVQPLEGEQLETNDDGRKLEENYESNLRGTTNNVDEAPGEDLSLSLSLSTGILEDEHGNRTISESSPELTSSIIPLPQQLLEGKIEPRITGDRPIQRLERILERLEILADQISCSATPSDSESDDESQTFWSSPTNTTSPEDDRFSEAMAPAFYVCSNELTDNADNPDYSNGAPPRAEETRRNARLACISGQTGTKRSLDSNGSSDNDEVDDDSRKRRKKSPDSSNLGPDQPTLDARDQIPCVVDDCSGKDAHISEMIRKCAKHHSFFVCTRCYLRIDDKATFEHHRAIGDNCEPHCISSSCGSNLPQMDILSLSGRRHKRQFKCPVDKKVSIRDRWQYLHHLRYPERPLVSLVLQPGVSHPHGSGRPKPQWKHTVKSPPSEQFRQQLAEAKTEIQNLRTQQALDVAMLEINAKEHSDQVLRLEMIIAACIELIPRIPGSLQRMLEVDAAGALKMVEKSAAITQAQYIQQPATLLTPEHFSRASQGPSFSPGSASATRHGVLVGSGESFTQDGAVDPGRQFLFDVPSHEDLPLFDSW